MTRLTAGEVARAGALAATAAMTARRATAHEHVLDLVTVAEELGFEVIEVAVSKVRLLRIRDETEVTIAGVFVNGPVLREVLAPQARRR